MTRPPLLAVALGITLLLGLPAVILPPFRDHAIFALVGKIILGGGLPYADAVDFKPPGVHLFYAVGALLSGTEIWGARLLDLLIHAVGVWALHRLLTPPLGATLAGLGALLYTVAYLGGFGYAELAQPEGLLVSFVLIARAIATEPTVKRWALAGLLIAAAVWLKYTAVFFLVLFAFAGGTRRTWGAHFAAFTGGVALVFLYLVAGGALPAFLTVQTEYLPGYSALVRADGFGEALSGSGPIVRAFFTDRPLLILALFAAAAAAASPLGRRRAREPLAGLVAALLGVLLQGKFFFYHWIPMLPFLIHLALLGATHLPRTRVAQTVAVAILLPAALWTTLPRLPERIGAARFAVGAIDREGFYGDDRFGPWGRGDYSTLASWRLAEAVRERSEPGDRLFVWGFEPLAYLASGRAPASRFIYNAPFVSPWCPEAWRDELAETLEADPPRLIVLAAHDVIPWVTGVPIDSREALRGYPRLRELIRTRYEPIQEVEHFVLLTRTS